MIRNINLVEFKKMMCFQYMYMAMPNTRTPVCPRGVDRGFHAYHFFVLRLSEMCKGIKKKMMQSQYKPAQGRNQKLPLVVHSSVAMDFGGPFNLGPQRIKDKQEAHGFKSLETYSER